MTSQENTHHSDQVCVFYEGYDGIEEYILWTLSALLEECITSALENTFCIISHAGNEHYKVAFLQNVALKNTFYVKAVCYSQDTIKVPHSALSTGGYWSQNKLR